MSSEEEIEDVPVIINGKLYPNIENNELDQISVTSFALGIVFGVSFATIFHSSFKNFNVYLITLSLFHLLEFWTTAKYNRGKVNTNSFLINNGVGYIMAHLAAIAETSVELWLFPDLKNLSSSCWKKTVVAVGFVLLICGQYVRSSAMITAGQSFSHIVKTKKNSDHKLITHGIYSKLRHPSYFGFFWWSVGSQLILLNPVTLVVFVVVLWQFFNKRIGFEERFLIQFFGDEYITYKKSVGVGIPCIK